MDGDTIKTISGAPSMQKWLLSFILPQRLFWGIKPDFLPVTLEIALLSFLMNKDPPSKGILHQPCLEDGSATQGLNHKALLSVTVFSIMRERDLNISIVASAINPAVSLRLLNEAMISVLT